MNTYQVKLCRCKVAELEPTTKSSKGLAPTGTSRVLLGISFRLWLVISSGPGDITSLNMKEIPSNTRDVGARPPLPFVVKKALSRSATLP